MKAISIRQPFAWAIIHAGKHTCARRDPWAVPGALGLILSELEPLSFVPWRGELGLFEADPPEYRGLL